MGQARGSGDVPPAPEQEAEGRPIQAEEPTELSGA